MSDVYSLFHFSFTGAIWGLVGSLTGLLLSVVWRIYRERDQIVENLFRSVEAANIESLQLLEEISLRLAEFQERMGNSQHGSEVNELLSDTIAYVSVVRNRLLTIQKMQFRQSGSLFSLYLFAGNRNRKKVAILRESNGRIQNKLTEGLSVADNALERLKGLRS